MERKYQRKLEPHPKKVYRSEGSFWVPNAGVTEHFLTRRLNELERHETMYQMDFRRGQKALQKELRNIQSTYTRSDRYHNLRRGSTRPSDAASINRRGSISEMIEKYKNIRTDQTFLNDLLKQKHRTHTHITENAENNFGQNSTDRHIFINTNYAELPFTHSKTSVVDDVRSALDIARTDDEKADAEIAWMNKMKNTEDSCVDQDQRRMIGKRGSIYVGKGKKTTTREKTRHIRRPRRVLLEEQSTVLKLSSRKKPSPTYAGNENRDTRQRRKSILIKTNINLERLGSSNAVVEGEDTNEGEGVIEERTNKANDNKQGTPKTDVQTPSKHNSGKRRRRKSRFLKEESPSDLSLCDSDIQQDTIKQPIKTPFKEQRSKTTVDQMTLPFKLVKERGITSADLSSTKEHLDINVLEKTKINTNSLIAETENAQKTGTRENDLSIKVQSSNSKENVEDKPIEEDVKPLDEQIKICTIDNAIDDNIEAKELLNESDVIKQRHSVVSASDAEANTADLDYVWDEVRRCRYLRGYDPPEMVMPRDEINVFVFGRDENDILEIQRRKMQDVSSTDIVSSDGEIPEELD